MSAFTISLKLFSQRFLWINSKYTNQRPFLSSHSHLCNVGQFWLLFPWNSSFVTSLCYWFAAYFFVYSADIYWALLLRQVLSRCWGCSNEWSRQIPALMVLIFLLGSLLLLHISLCLPNCQHYLRICPCLLYDFIFGLSGVSHIFLSSWFPFTHCSWKYCPISFELQTAF